MTRDQRNRQLSRDDAVRLATQALVDFTGDHDHENYPQKPSNVGKVSVGWIVEFKPILAQSRDGKHRMALTWVVATADRKCHIVGSIGLARTLNEIETGCSLR